MGFATSKSTSLNGSCHAHNEIMVFDVLLIISYLRSLNDF